MDSLAAIFVTSFMVALSGALMPGPVLTLTVAESARVGRKAGPLIILGHGLLELGLLCLLAAGLSGFISSPPVIRMVGAVGGGALALMGISAIISPASYAENSDGRDAGRSDIGLVAAGAVTSVSNPYWLFWWATVGVGYLAMSGRLGPSGVISFFIGHLLADLAWYSGISWLTASGRRFMTRSAYRRVSLACGIFLVLFGGWFIYNSALPREVL